MWHASGKGKTIKESRRLALFVLRGVGDLSRPDWEDDPGRGIYHVQRLLTADEIAAYEVGELLDVRGTEAEIEIVREVYAEAPHLIGRL